jgi:hypothetical protein
LRGNEGRCEEGKEEKNALAVRLDGSHVERADLKLVAVSDLSMIETGQQVVGKKGARRRRERRKRENRGGKWVKLARDRERRDARRP